jgi:hypothetical protein
MQPIYRMFCGEGESYDFSEQSALEAFLYESSGRGPLTSGPYDRQPNGKFNGYAVGKHNMDVTIGVWTKDIQDGILFKFELYEQLEEQYHWWLDKVIKNIPQGSFFKDWKRHYEFSCRRNQEGS